MWERQGAEWSAICADKFERTNFIHLLFIKLNQIFVLFSQNSENEDLDPHERKKLKKLKAMSDSEEEEEDDEDRLREELKDLIDDNPIEEGSDSDGDNSDSSRHEKRKKRSDDEDELDDRLEDDDYDLLEENLGVKVQRRVRIWLFSDPKIMRRVKIFIY